jgi:two-component system, chemotaxis family, CheB/CheR fusion protein
MAFVIIQHLDPTHESLLAEILSRETRMPVHEVGSGMPVEPDHVYVIPPNRIMELADGALRLAPRGETNGRHMPVDHFFRSLAGALKTRAIGVVLSGTASDGALGIEAIKAEGGITFAQEENSARHHGMPRAAITTGCVDFVLSPEDIARELSRIARHPHIRLMEAAPKGAAAADRSVFDKVLSLLRAATGVDFTHYRQSTIHRRISRRMALKHTDTLASYLKVLKDDPREVRSLAEDMLIHVTRFFRDRETFEFLERRLFPRLLKNRSREAPVRLWVPGCATGEEVYSLAITLIECCKAIRRDVPLQIFGTDLSETAIEKARAGVYRDNATADVPADRLRRYFVQRDGDYQIGRPVRDACVFARHNVLTDPPFLHLDLLSCRNLLIYLDTALQKRILPIFHHALNPNGFLLLGTAETIGTFGDLFQPEDKHHKVFSKKPATSRAVFEYSRARSPLPAGPAEDKPAPALLAADPLKEADRVVLSNYAPAGVVINEAMQVIQFRGRTGHFLEAGPGAASFDILKMAREGLLVDLRAAIRQARKSKTRVRRERVRVKRDRGFEEILLEVVPLSDTGNDVHHYLILFVPAAPPAGAPGKAETRPRRTRPAARGEERRIAKLEQEIAAAKEYLQAIIEEEEESTNEELRSANEEILSSNEELQSTNEELETAKEELQSANEELKTVNDELQDGNARLTLANSDLTNLLASVSIPIVMLDMDGRVRRFTAMAERVFHLVQKDVGRSIMEIRPRVDVPDLSDLIQNATRRAATTEREIRDSDGRWYGMRVLPYRTLDDRIGGAVLVFTDIDAMKRSEEQLQKSLNYADAVIETVREPLLVLDGGLRVIRANRSFYDTFHISPETALFRPVYDLNDQQWDIPGLRTLLEKIIPENRSFYDFEMTQKFAHVGEKTLVLNARRTTPVGGQDPFILLAIDDITERKLAEGRLRQAQKLDSVGRLAGGIAHDFNNLLNIISAYAALLEQRPADPKQKEGFEAIQRSVQRGSALVRQLLTFARKTDVVFGSVRLNALVEEVVEMLRETFPKEISVVSDLTPELPPIKADANQVHQALLNLCVNARDAMPQGGQIRFETASVPGTEVRGRFVDAAADAYALLKISDSGVGMDEETRHRMFDPFFTTKQPWGGQGLGLAVVHGIVQSHHGFIDVSSEAGKGTTVKLFFPVSPFAEEEAKPPARAPRPVAGTETILLVEDEDMLLAPVKALLEDKGYRVIPAGDGLEAVKIYEDQGEKIDLVILDMGLPKQGGRDTLLRLRSIDPAARILLASGYFDAALKQEMLGAGAKAFLRKPYSADEILRHAREALDSVPPRGAQARDGDRSGGPRKDPSLQ